MNMVQDFLFRTHTAVRYALIPGLIGAGAVTFSLGVKYLCENTPLRNLGEPNSLVGLNEGVICAAGLAVAATVTAAVHGFLNPREPAQDNEVVKFFYVTSGLGM